MLTLRVLAVNWRQKIRRNHPGTLMYQLVESMLTVGAGLSHTAMPVS